MLKGQVSARAAIAYRGEAWSQNIGSTDQHAGSPSVPAVQQLTSGRAAPLLALASRSPQASPRVRRLDTAPLQSVVLVSACGSRVDGTIVRVTAVLPSVREADVRHVRRQAPLDLLYAAGLGASSARVPHSPVQAAPVRGPEPAEQGQERRVLEILRRDARVARPVAWSLCLAVAQVAERRQVSAPTGPAQALSGDLRTFADRAPLVAGWPSLQDVVALGVDAHPREVGLSCGGVLVPR